MKIKIAFIVSSLIFVLLVFFLIIFNSLGEIFDSTVDLGNGYKYLQEDNSQSIIYQMNPDANGSGVFVVPPRVKSFSFNERHIIARSIDQSFRSESEEIKNQYWIIDKTLPYNNQVVSMDSVTFYHQLNEKGIELQFN